MGYNASQGCHNSLSAEDFHEKQENLLLVCLMEKQLADALVKGIIYKKE